ncbi:uncharacterized protein LOC134777220 [Penaeus indicus]|uniref:uncharacterized protein LOC134777220 n=1 Tax=Penaeus indicus TaxID=29960 RepID=UPI00300D8C20
MEELDAPPSVDELCKAIDSLACGKAPGKDGIPPEVIKVGKKTALLQHLHQLLQQSWEEGTVPQEMHDANIAALFKNKGDRSDCNNSCGISLLSTVGKAFARVVLNRLQLLAECIYPEAQCRFRAGRSTIDMIFSLRQLQEKCCKQRRLLYIAFIDLTKAFDLVSRNGLFTLLQKIGCPPKLLRMIMSFHEDMQGTVQSYGSSSGPFPIKSGVKRSEDFTYLGSTISSNLSLDAELNKRIDKAATAKARLSKKVWDNKKLTTKTKMMVYQACVLSTLLYGSGPWTLYSHQERRLNTFYLRNLRRILGITWQDHVSNKNFLDQAGIPSLFALLTSTQQAESQWLKTAAAGEVL